MKLSSLPPGIYACWVTTKSRGYFINYVSDDGVYCLYESYADKSVNYKISDREIECTEYATIFTIDELHNYADLKLKYPELFL